MFVYELTIPVELVMVTGWYTVCTSLSLPDTSEMKITATDVGIFLWQSNTSRPRDDKVEQRNVSLITCECYRSKLILQCNQLSDETALKQL